MARLLWICLGGALGTGARYLLSGWALDAMGPGFPYGTLAVNALGSFLICGIMHLSLTTGLISPPLRLFLTTGIMGGFTTYSTFDYETLRYVQERVLGLAALNVGATLIVCFVAGLLGDAAAKGLAGS